MEIQILTRELAEKYLDELFELEKQIPGVEHHKVKLLADEKEGRIFYGKWEHSLIMFDNSKPIGMVMAYERNSENNDQYPQNTLYINTIAISKNYQNQGLGKQLINKLIENVRHSGFKYLDGEVNFSVQTNSAEFNKPVQQFYENLGFMKVAEKKYDNRLDNIYRLN